MKLKLTLRDLFWLVLVCALGLGWWVDRRNSQALLTDIESQLKSFGGEIFYGRFQPVVRINGESMWDKE